MINPLWSGSTVLESAVSVPLVRLYGSETPNLRKHGSKISFAVTVSEKSHDICPAGMKRDGRICPLLQRDREELVCCGERKKGKGKELFKMKSNAGMRTNRYL